MIFMFAMISCGPFSVLWCPATCNTLCPTKLGPGGTYMSPRGESMYTYMGHVWRSTTHPTLPRIEKRPRLWKIYEKLGPAHMLHVFAFLTPTVGWLTEYFIKYSSHVLPHFSSKGKAPMYGWRRSWGHHGSWRRDIFRSLGLFDCFKL